MAKTANKKKAAAARAAANKLLADNRLARHQYEILDTLETGIELVGTEVKSIRAGRASWSRRDQSSHKDRRGLTCRSS